MYSVDFIKESLKTGKSLKQIARESNLDYYKLWSIAKKNNIELKNSGQYQFVDLTGKTFNRLYIIERVPNPTGKKKSYWKCRCECGTIKNIRGSHIIDGTTKSCGCYLKENNSTGYKELSGTHWCSIKNNAKTRNLTLNLTIEEAWDIFEAQDRKCALTGLPLKIRLWNDCSESNASLDRINSAVGYEKTNVQWIHKDVQKMKWDKDEDYFKEMCYKIVLTDSKLRSKLVKEHQTLEGRNEN